MQLNEQGHRAAEGHLQQCRGGLLRCSGHAGVCEGRAATQQRRRPRDGLIQAGRVQACVLRSTAAGAGAAACLQCHVRAEALLLLLLLLLLTGLGCRGPAPQVGLLPACCLPARMTLQAHYRRAWTGCCASCCSRRSLCWMPGIRLLLCYSQP